MFIPTFRDHNTAWNSIIYGTFSNIFYSLVNIEQIFLQVVNDFDIEEEEVAIENREEFLQKIEKRVWYCISFILFHRGLLRIERFIEAQAFLRSYDSATSPPPPHLSRQ